MTLENPDDDRFGNYDWKQRKGGTSKRSVFRGSLFRSKSSHRNEPSTVQSFTPKSFVNKHFEDKDEPIKPSQDGYAMIDEDDEVAAVKAKIPAASTSTRRSIFRRAKTSPNVMVGDDVYAIAKKDKKEKKISRAKTSAAITKPDHDYDDFDASALMTRTVSQHNSPIPWDTLAKEDMVRMEDGYRTPEPIAPPRIIKTDSDTSDNIISQETNISVQEVQDKTETLQVEKEENPYLLPRASVLQRERDRIRKMNLPTIDQTPEEDSKSNQPEEEEEFREIENAFGGAKAAKKSSRRFRSTRKSKKQDATPPPLPKKKQKSPPPKSQDTQDSATDTEFKPVEEPYKSKKRSTRRFGFSTRKKNESATKSIKSQHSTQTATSEEDTSGREESFKAQPEPVVPGLSRRSRQRTKEKMAIRAETLKKANSITEEYEEATKDYQPTLRMEDKDMYSTDESFKEPKSAKKISRAERRASRRAARKEREELKKLKKSKKLPKTPDKAGEAKQDEVNKRNSKVSEVSSHPHTEFRRSNAYSQSSWGEDFLHLEEEFGEEDNLETLSPSELLKAFNAVVDKEFKEIKNKKSKRLNTLTVQPKVGLASQIRSRSKVDLMTDTSTEVSSLKHSTLRKDDDSLNKNFRDIPTMRLEDLEKNSTADYSTGKTSHSHTGKTDRTSKSLPEEVPEPPKEIPIPKKANIYDIACQEDKQKIYDIGEEENNKDKVYDIGDEEDTFEIPKKKNSYDFENVHEALQEAARPRMSLHDIIDEICNLEESQTPATKPQEKNKGYTDTTTVYDLASRWRRGSATCEHSG
eukprot:m.76278 g.76278  ORF g.76278 m.76278 type:complete len:806 (+) comp12548_c0_seq1:119-2536(+)